MENLNTLLQCAEEWLKEHYTRCDVAADPKYVSITHPGGFRGVKRRRLRDELLTGVYNENATMMEGISMDLFWKFMDFL